MSREFLSKADLVEIVNFSLRKVAACRGMQFDVVELQHPTADGSNWDFALPMTGTCATASARRVELLKSNFNLATRNRSPTQGVSAELRTKATEDLYLIAPQAPQSGIDSGLAVRLLLVCEVVNKTGVTSSEAEAALKQNCWNINAATDQLLEPRNRDA